jgi:hypothetical protein
LKDGSDVGAVLGDEDLGPQSASARRWQTCELGGQVDLMNVDAIGDAILV